MKLKNLIYVLLIGILIINYSCKSDDEPVVSKTDADLIIGTWKKMRFVDNGSTEEYDECAQNGTTSFNSNGTIHDIPYYEVNGECVIDGESDGIWVFEDEVMSVSFDNTIDPVAPSVFEVTENTLKLGWESNQWLEYIKL